MTKNKGKNNFFLIIISFILLSLIYFITRIQNLNSIPVFADEAIYIRWSQIIKNVETLRFIPLTDGKQPLFMWILAPTLKFISDPLIAGRLLSIFVGWGILISTALTACIVFSINSKQTNPIVFVFKSLSDNLFLALLTALIYIFMPFTFFFDRMSLPDNMLSFFGIWSLLLTTLLIKFKRFDISLLLGFSLGLAWLTKSPAIYFFALSLGSFYLFHFKSIRTYYLPIVSAFLGFVIYNILRLGPQFHMIAIRNKDYIWSLKDIISHPLDPFKPHIYDIFHIYGNYISLYLLFFALIGLFIYLKQNKLSKILLVVTAWWILPLLANSAMAKVFTARYILFTLPPLIILLSFGIFTLYIKINILFKRNYFLSILFLLLLFVPNLLFIFQISQNPFNVKLPSTETGYLTDWTSGWGIKDISSYLKERSLSSNVIVGTEGFFGTLPDGLQIYTDGTNKLTVFGVGLGFPTIPEKLIDAKNHGDEVYLIMNHSRLKLTDVELSKLKKIDSYEKPDGDKLDLYQL